MHQPVAAVVPLRTVVDHPCFTINMSGCEGPKKEGRTSEFLKTATVAAQENQ